MKPKPPKCAGCPYEKRGRSFVPGQGPHPAADGALPEVILVGQGPGNFEAERGEPFCVDAPAGKMLTRWLYASGHRRERWWIDNAVRCLLKGRAGDEAPPGAVRECYRRHWGPAIAAILREAPETPVVACGTAASKFLAGGWAGMGQAGSFVATDLPPLETP